MRRLCARSAVGGFLALVALAVPAVILAVVPNDAGTLTLFPVTINAGSGGDQYDPHVDGSVAAYTSDSNIRYYDFSTGNDQQVPTTGLHDRLSDISGGKIALSRQDSSGAQFIVVYDTANGTTTEVDPHLNAFRVSASIGGNTVAFIDHGLSAPGETLVADLTGSGATGLTTDTRFDRQPSVSQSGDRVVWESCATDPSNCDISEAIRSGTSWSVHFITTTAEPEANPDTDGVVIVYDATRSGERDIYWQPVGGGAEQRLELPGQQRDPSVSGGLITFESIAVGATNADLFAYHIATNRLFRITSTSADETLNDVTRLPLPDGRFRVVWTSGEPGSRDVFGATFDLPPVAGSFTFGGFRQPVDPYPALNSLKAGAAVPVRFSLGGFQGLNIFAAGYPKSEVITCGSPALEAGIEETVTAGGSSLSYNASTDEYTYVWKTDKAWTAGTCRQLVIQFTDFSIQRANFKFK